MKIGISQFLALSGCLAFGASAGATPEEANEFFTRKVEPLLRERCYDCHSHEKKIKGGLALDSRAGWEAGGEGGPALVPGSPETSRIIAAVRYAEPDLEMPPKKRLSETEIVVLEQWVKMGAPDPRQPVAGAKVPRGQDWESIYGERLSWWSLQPVRKLPPPPVQARSWVRNEVDQFILASLEAKGLAPVAEADGRTLARRLSFALTGLPPKLEEAERLGADASPGVYAELVQAQLDSPHFGEHWARHWMDVIHYSDTHGYEWDTPAKNAWMYRDYLIRAFNQDVPFRQLVLEQIAGDLIPPRVDEKTNLNETLVGPMALRLGERRHGDNAQAEGVTQVMLDNIIDTVSKGFLATTVGCAHCHDHKLDAVGQRDYYGMAGLFNSSRWGVRSADATDPNSVTLADLKRLKSGIRAEVARRWLSSGDNMAHRIATLPPESEEKGAGAGKKGAAPVPPVVPDSLPEIWRHLTGPDEAGLEAAWEELAKKVASEREKRARENKANLQLLADFTQDELPAGWRIEGFGMKHGLVRDGEIVVADEGGATLAQLLPAGRWSHAWSPRLAGAVRSPLFPQEQPPTISVGYAAGKLAAEALIVDNAFHSEIMRFLDQPRTGWLTLTAGRFERLAGGKDEQPRRVYLELATKALNNYFPSRTGYRRMQESEVADERSWLGVTRVYQHAPGGEPQDELGRFAPLFAAAPAPKDRAELAARLRDLLMGAIERWSQQRCDSEDVRLLNEALAAKWLPNENDAAPTVADLVASYRATEQRLQADRVIGSVEDWNEGFDERLGVRGSYTDLGEPVPRGNIRLLGGPAERSRPGSSGRLEFAQSLASDQNPLTARVFVNRVWQHLFGEGLVRTPDDFGHLGQLPSHPELLDWLARRFMADGWSLKKLVALLVESATWRQQSIPNPAAVIADPDNRLWHHLPMHRLEAEAIRDAMLSAAGHLDGALYGPPIDPPRTVQDKAKRLFSGPLDGQGRRSLYTKMTMMEPPRFLALFNQPIPKVTVGKRDATNVPDQALALLNDPFVIEMARHWSKRVLQEAATSPEQRVQEMFRTALARPPQPAETTRLVRLAQRAAELRGTQVEGLMKCQPAWQDVAHAIFNLKEFIYVQ